MLRHVSSLTVGHFHGAQQVTYNIKKPKEKLLKFTISLRMAQQLRSKHYKALI